MRKLSVSMEKEGRQIPVGQIQGNHLADACFTYAEAYRAEPDAVPISISLPISDRPFSPEQTRNFFEGLLPEAFTRRCVAKWMHADEDDYLTILSGLGNECLGALRIVEADTAEPKAAYQKLTQEKMRNLAQKDASEAARMAAKSQIALTGASGKVSLYYDAAGQQWYQPMGNAPGTHIVKQSHVRLKEIVLNEQLCLLTAAKLGVETPESFIINTGAFRDREVLFATKRYDRSLKGAVDTIDGLPVPLRLHQEEFSQALGIAARNKYEQQQDGYLQKAFALLRKHSADPAEDTWKLWDITVCNYLLGNTDNHIKNLSLLYSRDFKTVRLAPAYDLINTTMYESISKDMSLSINGKYAIQTLKPEDFKAQAKACGLEEKPAMQRFERLASGFEQTLRETAEVLQQEGFENAGKLREEILASGGYSYLS